jgi:hypothetical protein
MTCAMRVVVAKHPLTTADLRSTLLAHKSMAQVPGYLRCLTCFEVPQCLAMCPELNELHIDVWTSVPRKMPALPPLLTTLRMRNTNVDTLDPIGVLDRLVVLDISCTTGWTRFPPLPKSLKELYAEAVNISEPSGIYELDNLEVIDLSFASFKRPTGWGSSSELRFPKNIRSVTMESSYVSSASSFAELDRIEYLNINSTCFDLLEIPRLPESLTELHASESRLEPEEVAHLASLRHLEIDFGPQSSALSLTLTALTELVMFVPPTEHGFDLAWLSAFTSLKRLTLYCEPSIRSEPNTRGLSTVRDLMRRSCLERLDVHNIEAKEGDEYIDVEAFLKADNPRASGVYLQYID